jgi:hypothetical protein
MNEPSSATWIRPLLGRADDMRAEVWLRCTPPAAGTAAIGPALVVSGILVGPECSTAATLPTTVSLVDQGAVEGQPPLARGVCTEPGFWTPELPNLYRAEVTLRRGDDVVASGRRMIGLRRLGVKGRSLSLDGRRYVPRGVACQANPAELHELRQLSAVAVVGFPSVADPAAQSSVATLDAMLTTADRTGVAVVIRLGSSMGAAVDPSILQERLEAWAAHPSVFLVTLSSGSAGVAAITGGPRRGTMLFGLEVDGLDPPPPLPDRGVDLLVVKLPEHGLPHGAWQQPPPLPLVAAIKVIDSPSAAVARGACDRLQADLAAWARPELRTQPWDWAGYLVT